MAATFEHLFEVVSAIWNWGKEDLAAQNSILLRAITPFVTTGFGAFFGAVFAFRNANRLQRRAEMRDVSRSLSKALNLSIALTNSALGLKRQSIQELSTRYENNRNEVIREFGIPTAKKTIRVDFDFQFLSAMDLPAKELVETIIEFSPDSDVIQQSIALEQTAQNLSQLLTTRNEILVELSASNIPPQELVRKYFGMQLKDGSKDERYFHVMTNLKRTVDDLIFHSYSLYRRLLSEAVSRRRNTLGSRNAVEIPLAIADFSSKAAELFPSGDEYQDWLRPVEKIKRRRLETKRKYFRRLEEKINSLP